MKKFAVYARIVITDSPDWFPEFYAQHGAFFDKHVTLKQTCLAGEAEISAIKDLLDTFFASRPSAGSCIELIFDSVRADPLGDCIMVDSRTSDSLNALQLDLLRLLKDHRKYEKPEAETYEKNFDPHITIADNMLPEETVSALAELPAEFALKGYIKEVVLIVDGALTAYSL